MKRPFTRLLALAGSVALGLVGAVALASPASAHHTTVTGTAVCTADEWVITWTVENWETEMTATLQKVTADPNTEVTNITAGATLPKSTKSGKDWTLGKLVGEQRVPLSKKEAELEVKGKWTNGNTATNKGSVKLDTDQCGEYTTIVTGAAKCDSDTGTWVVTWAVTNKHYKKDATASVITKNGPDAENSAVKTGDTWTTLADEDVIVGLKDGDKVTAGATKTATQTVAGTATAARLKVELEWNSSWKNKTHAVVAVVDFEGACVKNAPKPSVTFASDCTGVVTVTLLNGLTATKNATFVVSYGNGETSGEQIVEPGKEVTITVPASAKGLPISVTESGTALDTYTWKDSTDCHPFTIKGESSCTGLDITITNPEGGAPVTVVLTPGVTEVDDKALTTQAQVKALSANAVTKTVTPGATEVVHFDVEKALTVYITANGKPAGEIVWERPRGCEELEAEYTQTCTGMTFDFTNPEDGSTAEIKLTPNKGDAVTFTLNPGESKKVEFIAQGTELTVEGSLNGKVAGVATWEQPADCATPSPSAPPNLPKTGTNTTMFVLIGAVLVAIGAVLFLIARRRRLNLNDAV